jgi:hypothetical protein
MKKLLAVEAYDFPSTGKYDNISSILCILRTLWNTVRALW